MSSDWFYEKVVEYEAWHRRKERDKEERKKWRGEMAEALVVWKREDKERKERNVERCERYKKAIELWEKACDAMQSKPESQKSTLHKQSQFKKSLKGPP